MDNGICEQKLEKLVNILGSKYSTTLTFNSTCSEFTTRFPIPLNLLQDYNYEIGLTWFTVYNSIFNVTTDNNKFSIKSLVSNKNETKNIEISPGAYELSVLFDVIYKLVYIALGLKEVDGKKPPGPLKLEVDLPTLKTRMIVENKHEIIFGESSIGALIGYNPGKYVETTISQNIINISNVTSINLLCDLVQGTYQDGKLTNCLYNFPTGTVPSGYKITQMINTPIYLPIINNIISSISFKIVDQNNNLLNFNGETISFSCHLKQV